MHDRVFFFPLMSVKFQYIVIDNYSIHEWKMFMRLVYNGYAIIDPHHTTGFVLLLVIPIIVNFFPFETIKIHLY